MNKSALILSLLICSSLACSSNKPFEDTPKEQNDVATDQALYFKARNDPKSMTDSEWRQILDETTFWVTRQKGTERPWTSPFNHEKRSGTYHCSSCHQALFPSSTVSNGNFVNLNF